jgi:two-component sensor histidine kinase
MALMLHELRTNSNKYGALSKEQGRVTISWTVEDQLLRLRWVERGGPAVRAPASRGFGMTLIEQSAKSEGGDASMLVEAEGITWEITFPLPRPAVHVGSQPKSTAAEQLSSAQPRQARAMDNAP